MNARAIIKIKALFKVQKTLETQTRLLYWKRDRTQLEVIFLREVELTSLPRVSEESVSKGKR